MAPVAAELPSSAQKAASCAGCHGADGNSPSPAFPKLAGQHASYLSKQLQDFRSGARVNPVMNAFAADLSDREIHELGDYFSKQTIRVDQPSVNDPLGEMLFLAGDHAKGVPACKACHGLTGEGNSPAGFPVLRQQHADYLESSLHAFRKAERLNDKRGSMKAIAEKMSDEEIHAVAQYLAGLR